ncbi:hypothetical protein HED55_22855 [Ochrobactrum haematophilum]|uniref:Outer membrane autotransporter n=1 Tax=Brucella haematophila TaxID=419474 RepID=A0ABX1DTV4_9HYPH|nr:hypothetical protein [Brucella haematophila]
MAAGVLRIGDTGLAGSVTAQEIHFNKSNSQIIADFTDNSVLGAMITGTGSVKKSGVGTLILGGANTYSGTTNIDGGILRAGSVNTFSTNSAHVVFGSGVLDLNDFNQGIGSLAGSGTVGLGSATLTTGADNSDTSFSGLIQGTGQLIKTGTGTFTLTGNNIHTGGTAISAGTLVAKHADGSGVIDALGTGMVTLNGADCILQQEIPRSTAILLPAVQRARSVRRRAPNYGSTAQVASVFLPARRFGDRCS